MNTRPLKALALVAALSIPLAACSDDEEDASTTDTTAAAATDDAAAEDTAAEDTAAEDTAAEDTAAEDTTAEDPGTIVDIAASNPDFSTLVTAVTEAGLVETLSGGEFTVFAPTNAAFEALPAGTLDELLADPEGALTDVLTYHVVEGTVMAEDVLGMDGQEVTTVNGSPVTITVDGESVMVNDAVVVTTDIVASNGVIHVIDAVLVPEA
jgi:uncharacterized surface protein with fasciclin (FAS1) repeats